MDFHLTESAVVVQEGVRRIAQKYDLEYWGACDREVRFPQEVWNDLASGGWLALCIPEQYGGAGKGPHGSAGVNRGPAGSGGTAAPPPDAPPPPPSPHCAATTCCASRPRPDVRTHAEPVGESFQTFSRSVRSPLGLRHGCHPRRPA